VNYDAAFDCLNCLKLAIDLRGTNTNTARIEYGIRASVKNQAPASRQTSEVAVSPDSIEGGKICLAIESSIWIVPKADWHRRKWSSAHKLVLLADGCVTCFVKDFNCVTQRPCLKLFTMNRDNRATQREAPNDVCSTRYRAQLDVRLDIRVHVVKTFGNERR